MLAIRVFSVVCLILPSPFVCESQARQGPKDQSRLVVFVAVNNGHLTADRGKTTFQPTEQFKIRSALPPAEALKILLDDLDRAFASLPGLYFYALSDDEKDSDAKGTLNDAATNGLRSFTGNWASFAEAFNRWATAGVNRFPLQIVFSGVGVLQDVTTFDERTPLIFDDPEARDFDSGQLTFRVADPIGDLNNTQDYQITFADQSGGAHLIARQSDIVKLLKPLLGRLWRVADIRTRLSNYYVERGLQPDITLSGAGENPKQIGIRESLRIARIVLASSADAEIDKILYLLLSDKEFRIFLRNRAAIMKETLDVPGQAGLRAVDYAKQLGRKPGAEPYVNLLRLQIEQQQLALIGYTVAQVVSTARPQPGGIAYVDLQVQKLADSPSKGNDESAPLLANKEGVVDSNLQDAKRETPFVSPAPKPVDSSKSSSNTKPDSERKNYLGGGFLFTPGQGIKLIGIYQRSQLGLLSTNDSLSIKAGGQTSALGGVNYFADYVMFGSLHRRLSLQFTGSSDFSARRILDGVKTDERRTGGLARGELEWFRDLGGSLLRTYIEGRRSTVELTEDVSGNTIDKVNLTTVEVGGLYLFDVSAVRFPKTLRIEPRARFGLGLASTEPRFARLQVTGSFHQKLPRLFEVDVSARVEAASNNTPIFELPSLGGAESLRGFRTDDALGRQIWSLQTELWIPLPGSDRAETGISQFLRRSVRLATFFDVGGAYNTTGSEPGVRSGPGSGLRIIYNPVVLKLDWAYGLGQGVAGVGHGRFYFTVSTNLPF